jgi:hypothetical protein
MKLKKLSILVLSTLGLLSIAACSCEKTPSEGGEQKPGEQEKTYDGSLNNDFKVGGTVTLGNGTELSGDFRFPGVASSSIQASDQDILKLTTGYATMETDRTGSYKWNKTVVKEHKEEEVKVDGGVVNFKVTIEINPGLKLSDGTELKAKHFLAYTLAFASAPGQATYKSSAGQSFVGYKDFKAYTGEGSEKGKKEFAGLRLLGDYKFSMEIAGPDYYPYYFADTYGAVSPYDLKMLLGDADIKDDGNGAYLTPDFYAKDDTADHNYKAIKHFQDARFDLSTYAYTGPYKVAKFDTTTREATLQINENFAGNWEGQKPHIEKIVYKKVVSETQAAQLKSKQLDILEGITGGDEVTEALKIKADGNGAFSEIHYDRAGYGKLEFDCDFGPAQFPEVRHAVSYCLDRNDFANTFTGGYGSVVDGPYSVNFQAYLDNKDELEENLESYAVSVAKAKQELQAGGWTYNSKGEDLGANWAPGEGVDAVRYKKLGEGEFGVDNANLEYEAVSVDTIGGVEYKTVKIGNDYYLPCVINWLCTENNPVSDLLTTKLQNGTNLKDAGVAMSKTVSNFSKLVDEISREGEGYAGKPVYSLYNLATGWNSSIYDYSYNWIDNSNIEMYDAFFAYSVNKLSDPYDAKFSWWDAENQNLTFAQATEKSGGKLGMNYISFAMVYSVKPGNVEEYNKWFAAYMLRWNELLPDIPLYSNIYYDVFNSDILNYKTTPFFSSSDALLYCAMKSAQ